MIAIDVDLNFFQVLLVGSKDFTIIGRPMLRSVQLNIWKCVFCNSQENYLLPGFVLCKRIKLLSSVKTDVYQSYEMLTICIYYILARNKQG